MKANIQIRYLTKELEQKMKTTLDMYLKKLPIKLLYLDNTIEDTIFPKEEIYQVGMNVILNKDFPELQKYEVNKDNPLPTGEPLHVINKEAFPEHSQE